MQACLPTASLPEVHHRQPVFIVQQLSIPLLAGVVGGAVADRILSEIIKGQCALPAASMAAIEWRCGSRPLIVFWRSPIVVLLHEQIDDRSKDQHEENRKADDRTRSA
jgi:hypothetical protein